LAGIFSFMQVILFDDNRRYRLLPFTHTRPVADIRCGILTMRERWERYLNMTDSGSLTEDYLQPVFPTKGGSDHLYINGGVFGNYELATAIARLQTGQKLVKDHITIAVRTNEQYSFKNFEAETVGLSSLRFEGDVHSINSKWDIFSENDWAIRADFELLTKNRRSAAVPEGVLVSNPSQLFIEEGAQLYAGSVINAATGPVYIGKDADVLEGSLIRGPFAMCDHTVLKMGAKIYGATTLGPGCKAGGEINNVVFFANSNKSHDGYLGNAVIGEWCNLGADTNCSNLKNNYDEVKIWDEHENKSVKTGLTFCGLLMGDHSKCGINTMFNTGTVAGVSCNIYGGGFPEKFIPSFCWGGSDGMTTYDFNRAMETAGRMMARRGKKLSAEELAMYKHIFEQTKAQRDLFAH